jgi:DNA-binding transcriptional MocR family regulator
VDLVIEALLAGEKTVAVYRALRAAIVDGRLPRGHRLPATRTLAIDLGVSRGSVSTAYERLVAEAEKRGLAVEDLGRYATSQEGFVFGFGAINPALIGEGMAIFAGLLARHA